MVEVFVLITTKATLIELSSITLPAFKLVKRLSSATSDLFPERVVAVTDITVREFYAFAKESSLAFLE
jgi:hypothetical protein